jgi:autotransporter adhesin
VDSTAIGHNALATSSTCVGANCRATGTNSTAFGDDTQATGNFSTAVGENAWATNTNTIALGESARATFANSVAIGTNVQTARANQVVVGTATHTYTMPGIGSAASKAAQTGDIDLVTADAAGNLATIDPADLLGPYLDPIYKRLDQLDRRVDEAHEGIAMSFALAGFLMPPPGHRFAITANYGTFNSKNAVAMSGSFRVTNNIYLSTGVAVGLKHGKYGGRAGVAVTW